MGLQERQLAAPAGVPVLPAAPRGRRALQTRCVAEPKAKAPPAPAPAPTIAPLPPQPAVAVTPGQYLGNSFTAGRVRTPADEEGRSGSVAAGVGGDCASVPSSPAAPTDGDAARHLVCPPPDVLELKTVRQYVVPR